MAISTLRTKRSRPMRLTGEPANSARKPASSSVGQLGQAGRRQVGARLQLGVRGGAGEAVPRADGQAIVAAIDAVADQRAELERDRAFVLDGQVGNAARAHRACRAPGSALVGQISRQRVQEPQWSACGGSGGESSVV